MAGTDHGRRIFRVSRVREVVRTEEAVELPAGFDLAGEWQRFQHEFASRMAQVEVGLEVADAAVLRLSAQLRGWVTTAD